jgi:hypothetical protein
MKQIKKLLALAAAALLFTSCANTAEFLKVLGTPAAVQWDITTLGSIAKPRITSDQAKKAIHNFAVDLLQASNLDTSQLVALIPHTGNAPADALIAAAVSYLNSVIAKLGSHNPLTLAYFKAIGNGLIAAGF